MDNVKTLPPFFTLPEVLRFIAVAFDTKNKNKSLDDACRRVDTNYRQIEPWMTALFKQPLIKQLGQEYVEIQISFLSNLAHDYINYVGGIALDGLSRRQSTLLLIDNYFGIRLADFMLHIKKEVGGPSPDKLLDETKYSVAVLIGWLNQEYPWFSDFLTSLKKEDKDKIHNWVSGKEVPSRFSIMALFTAPLRDKESFGSSSDWQKIKALMLIARALDFFRKFSLGNRLIQVAEYSLFCPQEDIRLPLISDKLRSKVQGHYNPLLSLLFSTLDHVRKPNKNQDDYLKIVKSINEIENLKVYYDSSGKFDAWYHWIKGRYLVSIGENKKANTHYIKAFIEAIYRLGKFQAQLIEEAMSVAAVQGKNGHQGSLKQLKSMGILLGISLPNALVDKSATAYSANDIIDDFEVACLRHHFVKLFPDACLSMEKGGIDNSQFGPLWFSEKELNRKPNFNRPNENIKLKGTDGRIKKIPQLAFFAMYNKNNDVAALIKAGADVNKLSNDGESALLFAINSMDKTAFPQPAMNKALLDMLLQQDHSIEVLNRVTLKLNLLPLICAVKTGKISIVKHLLEQGASVDARGETDGQTALNVCLKILMQEIDPEFCKREMFKHQYSEASIESIKRHCAGLMGSSNAEVRYNLNQQMLTPIYRKIQKQIFDYHTQNWGSRYDIAELREIAILLLDSGADPNISFTAPVDGYTPLMLAAENNDGILFKYMIEKGGEPLKPYYNIERKMSVNCFDIAIGFESTKVIGFLKENYGTGNHLWPSGIVF
jgi:ankyrin repeat protein